MIEVAEYVDQAGRNAFDRWMKTLDDDTRARIRAVLDRVQLGNLSMLKGIGQGLAELRMHFGPGYRVCCGRDGDALVLLLGGGTKKRQDSDIEGARLLWQEYKTRKKALSDH